MNMLGFLNVILMMYFYFYIVVYMANACWYSKYHLSAILVTYVYMELNN